MAFIEIFKSGVHRTVHPKKDWTNEDVEAVFADTGTDGPVPIVFVEGHPKNDLPVVGRVDKSHLRLVEKDGRKVIGFEHGNAEFSGDDLKRLKKAGKNKFSVKINMRGPKYIKHIGFVDNPAVVDIEEAQFEGGDEPEYDYATFEAEEAFAAFGTNEYRVPWIGKMLQNLREWVIEKHGRDEADKVLPSYEINGLMESPSRDKVVQDLEVVFGSSPGGPCIPAKSSADFSQSNHGSTMTEQEIQALKDKAKILEDENKRLKDADKERLKVHRDAVIDAVFADEKYKGKIVDKNRESLRSFAESLLPEDAEFSAESDALKPLRDLLETMPVVHVEEEVATFEAAADGKDDGEDQRSKARKEISANLA